MRALILIATISAAAQLPARDAPQPVERTEVKAGERKCGGPPRTTPLSILVGPTVFAPADRIA